MGSYFGGLSGDWHVGKHAISVSGCVSKKNGMAYRARPEALIARCGVDRNRSLVQRRRMSPPLTMNASGSEGASNQVPPGRRIDKPGTADGASSVMKPESVCGAMLNSLSS